MAESQKLFVEVLRLASRSGLVKLGRLALDGTKIKAFSEIASRHGLSSNRAMSYDRMQTEEVCMQQEIRDWLAQAEAEDQAEDVQHGTNRRGDELPDELQRRESRSKKIRAAKAALEAEARAKAAAENAAKNAVRAAEGKEPQSIHLNEVQPDPRGAARSEGSTQLHRPRLEDHAGVQNKGWDQCGRMKRHGVYRQTRSLKSDSATSIRPCRCGNAQALDA